MHYYGVGWVDKPNVSDGLWACWVFNPTYLLCHWVLNAGLSAAHISKKVHRPDSRIRRLFAEQASTLRQISGLSFRLTTETFQTA